MKTPLEAVLLILSYEQLRLKRYRPTPTDGWTIGWGHLIVPEDGFPTGPFTITREVANAYFKVDLEKIEKGVLRRLAEKRAVSPVLLHDLCFGALVCLAFNTGADKLGAGLLGAIYDDLSTVPTWIKMYTKSDGKVLAGLIERRASEAALWEKGMKA